MGENNADMPDESLQRRKFPLALAMVIRDATWPGEGDESSSSGRGFSTSSTSLVG